MAKFFGLIGYGETIESSPGIHQDVIVERPYYGDVTRLVKRQQGEDNVNPDFTVGNIISILADAYAFEHFFAIRYVQWSGAYWTVTNVEVNTPRLALRLGKVYNGPKAATPGTP